MRTMENNTLDEPVEKLIENNLQLRYEVEALKKKMDLLKLMAKELLECSEPSRDPLKETRYICASVFIAPELKDIEK